MNKVTIQSGKDNKEKILRGAIKLANAVGSTLGPVGYNVLIEHPNYALPQVTKDGVTVARHINLTDPVENIGCQLVKQAAIKTAMEAGDGTTSSTIMAAKMMSAINDILNEHKCNVHKLRRDMEYIRDVLISKLPAYSKPIVDNKEIESIATISTNNDERLGKLIADAYKKIGNHGIITVEPSDTNDTTINVVDGYEIKEGWVSPLFVNNANKMTFESNEPTMIFVTNEKIESGSEILNNVLVRANSLGKSLVIIGENIKGEALQTLISNHRSNKMKICLINPPYYGIRRREFLNDLCEVLKMTPIYSDDPSTDIKSVKQNSFGWIESVKITKDSTIFKVQNPDTSVIADLNDTLQSLLSETEDKEEKAWIEKRIATINSGIATIKIGGNSETEIYETKDRIDDALAAVKSSLEEGISCGGGSTYVRLISEVDAIDGRMYAKLVVIAGLKSIMNFILDNFEYEGEVVRLLQKVKDTPNYGFNAKDGVHVEDMYEAGIIDPTKVIRNCIINSISVATMFAISNYTLLNYDETIL